MKNFYNEFANHYDKWVTNDNQAKVLTQFYSEYLSKINKDTKLIYLGIATGRIAVEIVKASSLDVIGVDISKQMLELCEKNFINHKLEAKLTLMEQNILDLDIPTSKNIFILPFRTLVHFLKYEDKKACLRSIYSNMKVGEVFIFDISVFDEVEARKNDGQPSLSYYDEKSGEVFYNQFKYNFDEQLVDVTVYKATLINEKLEGLTQHTYQSSWISPEGMEKLILEVGFCVQNYIGENKHQIWILEK